MSIFTKVSAKKPNSNTFDLSHDKKLSLEMGRLVPIHLQELVPGDVISMSTSQLLRMAPMISPVMHNIRVYTHFYFVPNRILWDKWEDFITGGEDGQDNSAFPFVNYSFLDTGKVGDYFGLPTGSFNANVKVSALPIAAYNRIYNEYYRDQNLVSEFRDFVTSGDNSLYLNYDIKPYKRAWQHDYFTSALPWTQKGDAVTIPLVDDLVPVVVGDSNVQSYIRDLGGTPHPDDNNSITNNALGETFKSGQKIFIDNSANLAADLSQATVSTINDLRRAFKLQEWLEKNARGGSRYTEQILSHFGVKSSDSRLQRPEYLGGGQSNVVISEVLQQSTPSQATSGDTPLGNMAGHGINVSASTRFKFFAEEHGYLIGIMSIMPASAYFQGLPKHFFKFDKFDYYWPSFALIGEQPIYNKEIYTNADSDDDKVFGYTPRYAEYKYLPSTVHGAFRTSLDFWHLGRKFANRPLLNKEFIECTPDPRIFAVTSSDEQLYCHVFHSIKAKRRMPFFGNPTF